MHRHGSTERANTTAVVRLDNFAVHKA
ncbi:hypothetical protein Tco_0616750, partial [Tanacetum coccineum]